MDFETATVALPLAPGTRVRFTTPYGTNAGTHEGVIVRRMVPNPSGFIALFGLQGAHYQVRHPVPRWGYDHTAVVLPDMIVAVLAEVPA